MGKSKSISREDVFETICKAARSNTLGLFVGSGFTKAVLNNNKLHKAYDWKELLQESCDRMGILREVFNEGMPYPQIASTICHEYVQSQKVSLKDAERKLKMTIVDLVSASPSKNTLTEYEEYFKELIRTGSLLQITIQLLNKYFTKKPF